jgi:hypothetical protein
MEVEQRPLPKPRFSGLIVMGPRACRSRKSAVPSVLALSTTKSSQVTPVCFAIDAKSGSRQCTEW